MTSILESKKVALCYASGDPHYRTWDGYRFDYQGLCEHYLVQMKEITQVSDEWFEVIAKNERRGSRTSVAYLSYIKIRLNNGNTEIVLTKENIAQITENVCYIICKNINVLYPLF